MGKVLKIIKREFISKVFTRGFLIGTILGPVFLGGIMILPVLLESIGDKESLNIRIVDDSGYVRDNYEEIFADTLASGAPRFVSTLLPRGEYEASRQVYHDAVEQGDIDFLLLVPPDVLQSNEITFISRNISQMDLLLTVRQRLGTAFNRIRLHDVGVDPQLVDSLTASLSMKTIKVSDGKGEEKGAGQEFFMVVMFLMMLYVTNIFYGQMVLRGVLEEKSSRIMEILLSSADSFTLMLGKIFGIGSAGLAQYLVWTLSAGSLFLISGRAGSLPLDSISIPADVLMYFVLFFLIGYFQFSAVFAAAGSLGSSPDDAQSLAMPVSMLVILPFIVAISLGIRAPNSELAQVLSFLPFFAPMVMFTRVMVANPQSWEILLSIGINIAAIFLLIWLCSRIYRVGILMYGKRPNLPEVLRWIRYR